MGFFSVVFFFPFRKDRFVSPLAIPLRPLRLCENIDLPRVLDKSLSPSRQNRQDHYPVSPLRPSRLCEKKTSRVYQMKVSRQAAKLAKSSIPLVLCVLRTFARI